MNIYFYTVYGAPELQLCQYPPSPTSITLQTSAVNNLDLQAPKIPLEQAMADTAQAEAPTPERQHKTPVPVQIYLTLYNFVSAVLWSTILGRVLLIAGIHDQATVYLGVGQFAKWTQTLAVLEVLHAAIGMSLRVLYFEELGLAISKGFPVYYMLATFVQEAGGKKQRAYEWDNKSIG